MTNETLYYASGDYVELGFIPEDADDIMQPGPADETVEAIARKPYMSEQLDALSVDAIRSELKQYGAWDEDELADDSENRRRLVWVLGCNAAEEMRQ